MQLTHADIEWPSTWRPGKLGALDAETFPDWWARLHDLVPPLHPQVYEQWVHRHWDNSPYFGLPLDRFSSSVTSMSTASIIREVGSVPGQFADPHPSGYVDLYAHLNKPMLKGVQPMHAMNTSGTWNFPILVIRSSDGFVVGNEKYHSPMWLIEGHLRLRYFKVLNSRNRLAAQHKVLVLSDIESSER